MSVADVAQVLAATLSPDTNTRVAAELKLAEYFTYPDVALSIAQLILSEQADLNLRQMSLLKRCSASISLRKYIKERWSPYFPTFKGGAPSVEVKSQVRAAVFRGLSDPNRKIRTLCAHTVSVIANSDWPDEYPDLLNQLLGLLAQGSSDAIHGAIQVLTEFIKADLTEDQTLPILRELLPVLLNILGDSKAHSAPTRARTISVFNTCVHALFMVKDQHPQAVKEAVASVLPVWLEAFQVLLNLDPLQDINATNWDGLLIRIASLDALHTAFPRALAPYLPGFCAASLHHLRVLYPTFAHYYISSNDSPLRSSEDETIELPRLLCPILDFLSRVLSSGSGRTKDWLSESYVSELTGVVCQLLQMTDEDAETWANNANAFIAQEDDETQPYSVRVAGLDLLNALIDRTTSPTVKALQRTLQETIQHSEQARSRGDAEWWRPLEAILAAIGSQSETILDCIDDEVEEGRGKPIDIDSLLSNAMPSLLNANDTPFLQGRAFVFASQYAKILPLQAANHYIEAALQALESDGTTIPVKVSAVKAINNFCEGGDDSALSPFVARIAHDLGPFLLVTSEDTLSLVLETLSVVLEVDKGTWLTNDLAASLVTASLEVWSKNTKDPIFISILTEILIHLAGSQTSGVYQTVVQNALPPLTNAIASTKKNESWIAAGAIDLVTSLVRGAPESGLGDGFIGLLAPTLFACLDVAEDRDVLQNGVVCLTAIIRKDCPQLLSWKGENNVSGAEAVLRIIARILRNEDEAGGLVIGDLIISLLRRAGDSVVPVLPDLLRAMLSCITKAKTATFLQSLIVPFAFLINSQRDSVVSLLETLDVDGRNGLDILIQSWCENASTFQGFWPSRVSTLGLTQLFVSERPSLQHLTVKGDIIIKPETKNVIMTRSRTRQTPHEFTMIPFPLKALKIILHDLQANGESATISARGGLLDDVDSDEGEDDWEEDKDTDKKDDLAYLSDLIGPKGVAFDNDELLDTADDEEFQNDPISQLDLQSHLVSFLRECATRNVNNFGGLVDQMTLEEILVIRSAIKQEN